MELRGTTASLEIFIDSLRLEFVFKSLSPRPTLSTLFGPYSEANSFVDEETLGPNLKLHPKLARLAATETIQVPTIP